METTKISNNKSSALISPQPLTSSPPFIASLSDPMFYVPKLMFLTKGKGVHKDHLTSFELALRDADIADLNLVSVSSIIPPQCKIISRQEGRKYLRVGQIAFAILARSSTNEPNRLIASSIDLARPTDEYTAWLPVRTPLNWRNCTEGWRLCRGHGHEDACNNP
jgi:hypothetical protein